MVPCILILFLSSFLSKLEGMEMNAPRLQPSLMVAWKCLIDGIFHIILDFPFTNPLDIFQPFYLKPKSQKDNSYFHEKE